MAKTDWRMGDVVHPEDINEIGEEINQLREDLDNIDIPPASTTEVGVVQLSSAVDSDSESLAATPKAVKTAYDRAEEAFLLGNERKEEVVDALIAIGVEASISESWDILIGKVSNVIRATGNAAVGEVLSGRTFSNGTSNGLTGKMPNHGAVNPSLTTQGQRYTIPNGYHNGTGTVTANISNLNAGNVRSGTAVGGVTGTFSQFSNGATATQILTGRSAAVNGAVVNGSMANRTGNVTGQSISRTGTTLRIRPQAGHYPGGADNSVQYNDPNWVAANIRNGVSIFGLTGTLDPMMVLRPGNLVLWRESGSVSNTTYSKLIEYRINIPGIITVSFSKSSNSEFNSYVQLRRGTEVLETISGNKDQQASMSIELSINKGDVLALWGRKQIQNMTGNYGFSASVANPPLIRTTP